MKIVARINAENVAMVESLKQRDINAKLVKGGVIVELPASKDSTRDDSKYEIPNEVIVANATLFIDCEEKGGGMTNTGSGTVVCGLSGKALRPYYVPKGYCNADHAHFLASKPQRRQRIKKVTAIIAVASTMRIVKFFREDSR